MGKAFTGRFLAFLDKLFLTDDYLVNSEVADEASMD